MFMLVSLHCFGQEQIHNKNMITDFYGDTYVGILQDGTCVDINVSREGYMETATKEMMCLSYHIFNIVVFTTPLIQKNLLLRQEGKKVFRYSEKNKMEVELFDFGLNEGDEFTTEDGVRMKVEKVADSSVLDNSLPTITYGRTLWLTGTDDKTISDVWVEDVGSIYHGMMSNAILQEIDAPELKSVYYLFRANMSQDAFPFFINEWNFKGGAYQVTRIESDITQYEETAHQEKPFIVEFVNDSLHISGTMCSSTWSDTQYIGCVIDEDTISVKVYQYPPLIDGPYLFYADIKIPGFKKGMFTVNIQYDNISEDEISYSNVACNPPSSISSVKYLSTDKNDGVYDLTGRRLSVVPQKGMYIQNGKKILKK